MEEQGAGWLTFSAVVLIFAGVMRFFDSIWAFRVGGHNPALHDSALGDNLKTYGWVYLLIGAILVLAGIGILYRGQFSRWIGVIAAALGGLSAMPWLPYYPVWSLVYIFIAVMVMYALIAYGGREELAV